MEKLDLNKIIVEKNILGKGSTSKCYLCENGLVLKVFNNFVSSINIADFSSVCKKMAEAETSSFILPIEFCTLKGNVIGYFMKLVEANTLDKISSETKLSDIIDSIEELTPDILKVSNKKIKFVDLHSRDIYFKNKFYIGDIDMFKETNLESNDIFNSNMKMLLNAIIAGIFNGCFSKYYYFLKQNEDLKIMNIGLIEGETRVLDIKKYFEMICEKLNCNFNEITIVEIRNKIQTEVLENKKSL